MKNGRKANEVVSIARYFLLALLILGCAQQARADEPVSSPAAEAEPPAATEPSSPALRIGPALGVNFANISVTPSTSTSSRTGLSVGLVGDIPVSSQFYLEPGILYSQYGYKLQIGGNEATEKYDVIEIPVVAKVKFPLVESKFLPFLLAGPNFGFRVSNKVEAGGSTTDASSDSKSFGVSLLLGAGLEFAASPTAALILSARYQLGLTNMSNTDGVTAKQKTFQFLLGVLFSL